MSNREAEVYAVLLGATIGELRQHRALGQTELATAAGISQSMLSPGSNGAGPSPRRSRWSGSRGASAFHRASRCCSLSRRSPSARRSLVGSLLGPERIQAAPSWGHAALCAGPARFSGLVTYAVVTILMERDSQGSDPSAKR